MKREKLNVIRDLSFSIKSGEVVAIIGASGSGKSLLAHSILGLLPYNAGSQGEIEFCGKEIEQKDKEKLRGNDIVLVPQSVQYLDPLMKIGEQIAGENADNEKIAKMNQTFTRYGLGKEVNQKYPFQMSGGMIRRSLISSAVLQNPKLIIADEPTPGLHIDVAKRVLGHFKEFANNGSAVLLITHDLELALTIADKVLVLYAGTTAELANVKDFESAQNLRHPYTKALFEAMPKNGFKLNLGIQPYSKSVGVSCPYLKNCPNCVKTCENEVPWIPYKDGFVRCNNLKGE